MWVEDFANRSVTASNSHEQDRLLEVMTEDIVYNDSAWPRRCAATAMCDLPRLRLGAFPDLRFLMTDGPYIAPVSQRRPSTGRQPARTRAADPPGLAPTGRAIEFEGADFHEYRDERVSRLIILFDMADVSRQLGMLSKPG